MIAASPLPWHACRTPKRGHSEDEYEDAWAANPRAGRFAVADGASESSYAGLWADLLAKTFVSGGGVWNGLDWLVEPRRLWSAAVDGRELPWYAEAKRNLGAYATLLGVSVRLATPGHVGRWQALAVGDSCLVRVRDGSPPRAFPLTTAAEFGNQPRLLGSRPGATAAPMLTRGACRPGDRLFLMTDALAQWFLQACENGEHPWDDLAPLLTRRESAAAFADWIGKRRDRGDLRNDDVTLLAVGPIPATTAPATE